MQKVTDPREIIDFLRNKENKSVFGMGREITHYFYNSSRHGCCVQLRQFFRDHGKGYTLHYEIEEYDGGIGVEIHSETKTPWDVHDFIRTQFLKHGVQCLDVCQRRKPKLDCHTRFGLRLRKSTPTCTAHRTIWKSGIK